MRRALSASPHKASFHSMRIGETAYICVYANKPWNDSGINVVWGQRYNFRVPEGETWIYRRRTCNADGHPSTWLTRPWESLRRIPEARWFQLVGAIQRSTKSAIVIGRGLSDLLALYPGRLYFFANDLPWMYWSNTGTIAVRITRTK
jgi:hypothetical protein